MSFPNYFINMTELNEYLLERLRRRTAYTGGPVAMEPVEPEYDPPTDAELKQLASYQLKQTINGAIANIDGYGITPDKDDTTFAVLTGYRAELVALRTLPGTADAINAELLRITTAINNIMDYKFRFETI
jgi:hypothetical protein